MSVVVIQKYSNEDLLRSIERYRINHLLYELVHRAFCQRSITHASSQPCSFASRLVLQGNPYLELAPPLLLIASWQHPSTRKYNLSSVRCCMVAAAPLSAELTAQLLDWMPHIHLGQGYGTRSHHEMSRSI